MFGVKTKIKKLIDQYFYYDALTTVRLDPSGMTCNHKCIMCWQQQLSQQQKKSLIIDYQKNKLLLKDYQKLISSFPKSVNSVELVGGGEPLLFENIEELIELIKEKKYSGSLITNGVFLSEPIRKTLINSKWEFVRISLHASSSKIYKKIHSKNDFEIVINNINALLKERKNKLPNVKLLFVVQKTNFHELKKFIKLAEKIKVDEVEFDYLIPNSKKELFLNKNELINVKKELNKMNTSLKNNISSIKKMLENDAWNMNKEIKKKYFDNASCHLNHLEISQTGNTTPCCLLWNSKINKNLNIKNMNIKNIWRFYKPLRLNLRKGNFPQDCIENCYYDLKNKKTTP